jgi:hypothetical protein
MTDLHLPPMPTDAPPVILPSLLTGLNLTRPGTWVTDPDVRASLDDGLLESFEEFCARISKEN